MARRSSLFLAPLVAIPLLAALESCGSSFTSSSDTADGAVASDSSGQDSASGGDSTPPSDSGKDSASSSSSGSSSGSDSGSRLDSGSSSGSSSGSDSGQDSSSGADASKSGIDASVGDAGTDAGVSCLSSIPSTCPNCATMNASDVPMCQQYLACFQTNHCNPADACGQLSGVCGPNTIGGGLAPYDAAVATYNCACP